MNILLSTDTGRVAVVEHTLMDNSTVYNIWIHGMELVCSNKTSALTLYRIIADMMDKGEIVDIVKTYYTNR